MIEVVVPENCMGPPGVGHGGYVAGLLARRIEGASQITLRRPTPCSVPLAIDDVDGGHLVLREGDDVLVEAEPAALDLDVPPVPSVEAARAAEAGSPSRWDERGVHPICFGCSLTRDDDEGLEAAVGPLEVDGHEEVAGVWRPPARLVGADGGVDTHWVLAALDCPGAMAYIARGTPAGLLLGRIVFEQTGRVEPDVDHVVMGWQLGQDGRKLLAGTALATADGTVLARSRQIWFPTL